VPHEVESRPHFIFLNRAYIICNNWSLFHDEFSRLSLIFSNNGYPKSVFDTCVQKFLDKKYSNGQTSDNTKDEQLVNFSIPYIGHASLVYKKKLVKVFKSIGIEIRVVFKSFKVKNYFSLKEVTPMNLKSNVVYQFFGSCDKSISYIGKTKRHFFIRFMEHRRGGSAISSHSQECQHCQDFSLHNFRILNSGKSDFETRIKEALYIKYSWSVLNNQLINKGSEFFLNILNEFTIYS